MTILFVWNQSSTNLLDQDSTKTTTTTSNEVIDFLTFFHIICSFSISCQKKYFFVAKATRHLMCFCILPFNFMSIEKNKSFHIQWFRILILMQEKSDIENRYEITTVSLVFIWLPSVVCCRNDIVSHSHISCEKKNDVV